MIDAYDAADFWLRVPRGGPDDCWPWIGKRDVGGYGRFQGRSASQVALELAGRPLEPGQRALHSCDNPPCVNQAHLRGGTMVDNAGDARRRGRYQYGDQHWTRRMPQLVARGDRHGSRSHLSANRGELVCTAKLTAADVREIRVRYAAGGVSMKELAAEYGVRSLAVFKVIHRQSWAHVE